MSGETFFNLHTNYWEISFELEAELMPEQASCLKEKQCTGKGQNSALCILCIENLLSYGTLVSINQQLNECKKIILQVKESNGSIRTI